MLMLAADMQCCTAHACLHASFIVYVSVTAQLQCHIASCGACYNSYSCQMPDAVSGLVATAALQFTGKQCK